MDSAAIAAVIGAVVGGAFAFGGTFLLQWLDRKRLSRNVRTLLHMEIDRNRERAQEYRDFLNVSLSPGEQIVSLDIRLMRLTETRLPQWRHEMWRGQSQYLALTLKRPALKGAEDHYARVDELTDLWTQVNQLRQKRDFEIAKLSSDSLKIAMEGVFRGQAEPLYHRFEDELTKLVQDQNPIPLDD